MGAKGAVEIIFRGKNTQEETAKYQEAFANPLKAAERGYIDDIIQPSETRDRILNALIVLENKQRDAPKRRHDNLPLWETKWKKDLSQLYNFNCIDRCH